MGLNPLRCRFIFFCQRLNCFFVAFMFGIFARPVLGGPSGVIEDRAGALGPRRFDFFFGTRFGGGMTDLRLFISRGCLFFLDCRYYSQHIIFLIADYPSAVLAFYFAILLPGLPLTYRFHAIFKIDDISPGWQYDEACKQACRNEYFHLWLFLSSNGYMCLGLKIVL